MDWNRILNSSKRTRRLNKDSEEVSGSIWGASGHQKGLIWLIDWLTILENAKRGRKQTEIISKEKSISLRIGNSPPVKQEELPPPPLRTKGFSPAPSVRRKRKRTQVAAFSAEMVLWRTLPTNLVFEFLLGNAAKREGKKAKQNQNAEFWLQY